jgi:broad specificity phosphatase PhoE
MACSVSAATPQRTGPATARVWSAVGTVRLLVGSKVQYKFICNGAEWKYDPRQGWEADSFSNINNVLIVPDTPEAVTESPKSSDPTPAGAVDGTGRPASDITMPSPMLRATAQQYMEWATPSEAMAVARSAGRRRVSGPLPVEVPQETPVAPPPAEPSKDKTPLEVALIADAKLAENEFGLDISKLVKGGSSSNIPRSHSMSAIASIEAGEFDVGGMTGFDEASIDAQIGSIPGLETLGGGSALPARPGEVRTLLGEISPPREPAGRPPTWRKNAPRRGRSNSPGAELSRRLAATVTPGRSGAELWKERGDDVTEGRSASAVVSHMTGTMAASRREGKLVLAMVGLPARGKTHIAHKLRRYLNWMGMRTDIFNVGNYRRKILGAGQDHTFFDPSNTEAMSQRQAMADAALGEMVEALRTRLDVAIFDATNTTKNRRAWLQRRLDEEFSLAGDAPEGTSARARAASEASTGDHHATESLCQLVFIESICTDEEIVRANVRATKLKSPDYQLVREEEAVADFLQRISHYIAVYEPIGDDEDSAYIKLVDAGRKLIAHQINGFLNSRLLYFLSNLRVTPKAIWITRHGESEFNVSGRIGGDSNLSSRGKAYAKKLADYMNEHYPPGTPLTVWTSTLRRTQQTVAHLTGRRPIAWRNLDEIDAGVFDGKTYEWIATNHPREYEARKHDKYGYRYPQGESYQDVAQRLEPILLEIERTETPILIVSHQATLRVLLGYLLDKDPRECPDMPVPLHTLMQITPKPYKVEEARITLA